MITLAIETSTPHGSVALFGAGEIVFEEKFTADRSHSSALFESLEKARKISRRINQVAVGLGPGSYAGVRIAISSAIGLQMGMGAILLGLASVASIETDAREYFAIGDARRESYYLSHVIDGVCVQGPQLATEAELRAHLLAHPTAPVFASEELPSFPTVRIAFPSAAILARRAAAAEGIIAEGTLEPIYLREPHITQPRVRL